MQLTLELHYHPKYSGEKKLTLSEYLADVIYRNPRFENDSYEGKLSIINSAINGFVENHKSLEKSKPFIKKLVMEELKQSDLIDIHDSTRSRYDDRSGDVNAFGYYKDYFRKTPVDQAFIEGFKGVEKTTYFDESSGKLRFKK